MALAIPFLFSIPRFCSHWQSSCSVQIPTRERFCSVGFACYLELGTTQEDSVGCEWLLHCTCCGDQGCKNPVLLSAR